MKVKDLLRLPFGKHDFTDGIYNYKLEKCISDYNKSVFYRVTNGGIWGNSLVIHLCEDDIYEKGSYEAGRYFRKVAAFHMSLGGINVHGEKEYDAMRKWKLLPKSSYKEWLKKVEDITVSPLMNEKCGVGGYCS